jgi:hypothetical protein
MKLWNKLNNWLEWRGIKWTDIVGASIALGTIVGLVIMLTWAGLQ